MAIGRGNKLEIVKEIHFPHSLGLLYSAFTYYTGFRVNSGEYKMMGLAPYGNPIFYEVILKELIDLNKEFLPKKNKEHFLDLSVVFHCYILEGENEELNRKFEASR